MGSATTVISNKYSNSLDNFILFFYTQLFYSIYFINYGMEIDCELSSIYVLIIFLTLNFNIFSLYFLV